MDAVIKITDKRYSSGNNIKYLNNTSYFEIENFLQSHKKAYKVELFHSPEHMKNIERWDRDYGLGAFNREGFFEFMKAIDMQKYKETE